MLSPNALSDLTDQGDRFQSNPYLPYRKELLSPARVKEVSRLRPWIPVVHVLMNWFWILGAWFAVVQWPSVLTVVLVIPVIGNRYYSCFIIGHDAFHRQLFRNPVWNDRFADVFINGPLGVITRINKRNHLMHHSYLGTEDDPDRHKYACSGKATTRALLGYLTGITSLARSFTNVFLMATKTNNENSAEQPGEQYCLMDFIIILTWQIALVGVLTYCIAWWAYPVLWLLPVFVFAYLGDSFRSFCEHSQPAPDEEADEHRLITYIPNRLERMLFAPMNMNFHAVHHLWPSIPYYNLPLVDAEIRDRGGAMGLEWRSSYVGYALRYWLRLPLKECQSSKVSLSEAARP